MPAGNTATRCASSRSGSVSRSQLQSTTARSVRWRSSAVRLPPVSRRKRSSSLAATCCTGSERKRAAASSIASGRPSRRRQISMTASTVSSSTSKPADAAAARSAKSCTDGCSRAAAGSWPSSGRPSGGTIARCSPSMPSGSRLVATTRRRGQCASRRSTSAAASATRCSQLSMTRRVSRGSSASTSRSKPSRAPPGAVGSSSRFASREPRTASSVGTRLSPSERGASSASQTPPGVVSTSSAASSQASRVLPAPPGPTSVTRRWRASSPPMRSRSSSRPTKLVSVARRLLRRGRGAVAGAGGPLPLTTARCASRR